MMSSIPVECPYCGEKHLLFRWVCRICDWYHVTRLARLMRSMFGISLTTTRIYKNGVLQSQSTSVAKQFRTKHGLEWTKPTEAGHMIEQLQQLCTLTWDGNLLSKHYRDKLVDADYARKINGYNLITENGIIVLANLGLLPIRVQP